MGIINRLQYGRHFDLLVKEYEVFQDEFKKHKDLFCIINKRVINTFKDREAAEYEFDVLSRKYHDVVSAIVANALADIVITSGLYHLHRGLLTSIGSEALFFFYELLDNLEKSGYYSKDKVDEERKWVQKEVSEVG